MRHCYADLASSANIAVIGKGVIAALVIERNRNNQFAARKRIIVCVLVDFILVCCKESYRIGHQ